MRIVVKLLRLFYILSLKRLATNVNVGIKILSNENTKNTNLIFFSRDMR